MNDLAGKRTVIHMSNKIKVVGNDEPSYMAPEGSYLARLDSQDTGPDKNNEVKTRLRFELEVPDSNGIRFMAGRSCNPILAEGSDLHWFIKTWLGEEQFQRWMEAGADFNSLIGRCGIVEIKHVYGKHPKPFVKIASIRPVGSVQDSVTVNVPKLVKAIIGKSNTSTCTKNLIPAVAAPGTMTATASACPYCGAEVNRFGAVR